MKSISDSVDKKPWKGWVLFIATVIVVFVIGMLTYTVMERRTEAVFAYTPEVEIGEFEPRNEVWGKNFPRQYQSWKETKDTSFQSMFLGSKRTDVLEEDPNLVVLWAGYGFSKGYNSPSGHYWAVDDIRKIQRTGAPKGPDDGPMPATCWTCKSPDVPRLMNEIGIAEFYRGKWAGKGEQIVNPIGCADCHDSKTMNLKISRPALKEAFGYMGKDIEDASHQEMRTLVCAQCHVEYYFDKSGTGEKKGSPYLTFPWKDGLTVEDMEAYYDSLQFKDWTHKISKAPMLKAQHPGYELFQKSIHYQRGVSCADCHMPYKSEGGVKFTDHKIQSPLNNVANSCQVCHREAESELYKNVYDRQIACREIKDEIEPVLVRAHYEAGKCWELGATEEQMQPILMDIRHAQWRWDYGVASHGASFHAPLETARVLSTALGLAKDARYKARILLTSLGFEGEVPVPDISTKEKAQLAIGLDPEQMKKDKKEFLETLVPEWLEKAKAREAKYNPSLN